MTQQTYSKICYTEHDKERKVFEPTSEGDERTPFERDRSRIIHSAAFRRLQGKTQVFTLGEGDFFRTRLTHSLEVSQVGKGLALRLGADPDLVEAICLVHDIGHPPFGHAGEDELKKLLREHGGFEANAQNIRILTKLEHKSSDYLGLNLTRGVIDGQLKYKEPFSPDKRKFLYENNMEIAEWASNAARSVVTGVKKNEKSFECKIMDWADEVAYAVHDLEDSIHAGYIDAFAFEVDNPRSKAAVKAAARKFQGLHVDVQEVYDSLQRLLKTRNSALIPGGKAESFSNAKIKRKEMTSFLINRYITGVTRVERGKTFPGPTSHRYVYSVEIPLQHQIEVTLINNLIRKFVFESPQVYTLESKGRHIIRCIFESFMHGDSVEYLLPNDWRELLGANYTTARKARIISDYISGMTDEYAQKTYARLFLPNQGTIYEVL